MTLTTMGAERGDSFVPEVVGVMKIVTQDMIQQIVVLIEVREGEVRKLMSTDMAQLRAVG